jgi:hypothetical protein
VTTAEIKPFEPETGNAGVGKKNEKYFCYTFYYRVPSAPVFP